VIAARPQLKPINLQFIFSLLYLVRQNPNHCTRGLQRQLAAKRGDRMFVNLPHFSSFQSKSECAKNIRETRDQAQKSDANLFILRKNERHFE
jgi:hypothetical protein